MARVRHPYLRTGRADLPHPDLQLGNGAPSLVKTLRKLLSRRQAEHFMQFTTIFSWAETHAQLISAVLTFVYVVLTYRIVRETRKLRRAQTGPQISISLVPSDLWINFIELEIVNRGQGAAKSLSFKVIPVGDSPANPELYERLLALNAIRNGIRYLGPRRQFRSFLTSMPEGKNATAKQSASFDVEVSYRTESGEKMSDRFSLDFSELIGLEVIGKNPLHQLADQSEEIAKTLKSIVSRNRLNVDIFTAEDRKRTIQETRAWIGEINADLPLHDGSGI